MRKLLTAVSALALMVVFAEGLLLATLWAQGRLNRDIVNEIREILRNPNEVAVVAASTKTDGPQKPTVTLEEVLRDRSLRVLQISEREREYLRLQALVTDSRTAALKDRELVTRERDEFAKAEKARIEREQSESIERARAILAKSDIAAVADQLMKLPLDENLLLLKGMPEKRIADLLQTLSAGDAKSIKRGQELFQAISSNKPGTAPDSNTASRN